MQRNIQSQFLSFGYPAASLFHLRYAPALPQPGSSALYNIPSILKRLLELIHEPFLLRLILFLIRGLRGLPE